MAEIVHERALGLVDREGTPYDLGRVYAEPQGSTWGGWVEFVSTDAKKVVRTDRETTQSNLEGVAYWAEGLEEVYFEGALDRATRRTSDTRPATMGASPRAGAGVVQLRLETVDPHVPFRLMAARTLVPGQRRQIFEGGVLMFKRTVRAPTVDRPGAYDFVAQFGSENAAGIMANTLWNDLHGVGATLEIEGEKVAITNASIKDALVGARVS
jgi:hypothetical protein